MHERQDYLMIAPSFLTKLYQCN